MLSLLHEVCLKVRVFFFQLLRPKGISVVVNPSLIAYRDAECLIGYLSSETNENKTKPFCKWITKQWVRSQVVSFVPQDFIP